MNSEVIALKVAALNVKNSDFKPAYYHSVHNLVMSDRNHQITLGNT